MHLEVTFRNLKPRDEVRKRAQTLFGKLERFLDPATEATLEVALDHGVTRTELRVAAHGDMFISTDEDEDLRTSMDRTFHTIEVSLRRAKEKRISRRHEAGEPIDGFAPIGEDEDEATDVTVA